MPISTFLNGRNPTQLRGVMWLALSDVATVQAGTVVSDGGGGGTTSWAATGTVACRIDPLGDVRTRLVGGRIDESSTHIVTVPTGASVSAGSRVVIAGRGTFEITQVRERTDALADRFEVIELT